MRRPRIAFITTMDAWPWGGSEELWSRTALRLNSDGLEVSASVPTWAPPAQRISDMIKAGIDIHFRPRRQSLIGRAWRLASSGHASLMLTQVNRILSSRAPTLVVFSNGNTFPDIDLLEACVSQSVPFATIAQANFEDWWPPDELAQRYRAVLSRAVACFFVSKANQRLAFNQIGCELPNSEVIWNPVSVDLELTPPFPRYSEAEGLLMACVARLHPPSKGQDILLEALATPVWLQRNWRLHLYGEGPWKTSVEKMVQRFGLQGRVALAGHRPVYDVWAANQVLVMPSRYEGLPISMIEASLYARTTVATAIAGNSEVIDDGLTGFLADAPRVPSMLVALERLWERRTEVEGIGQAAARRVREMVPVDPIEIFSSKLKSLC